MPVNFTSTCSTRGEGEGVIQTREEGEGVIQTREEGEGVIRTRKRLGWSLKSSEREGRVREQVWCEEWGGDVCVSRHTRHPSLRLTSIVPSRYKWYAKP
jgi:hypothetical protein